MDNYEKTGLNVRQLGLFQSHVHLAMLFTQHRLSYRARRRKHSISSCHTKQRSVLLLRRLSGTPWSRAILHWPIYSISAPDILYCGNEDSQLRRYCSIGNTTILFQNNYLVSLGNTCPSHFGPWYMVLMLPNSATSNMISGFASCVIVSFRQIVTKSQSLSIAVLLKVKHFMWYIAEAGIGHGILSLSDI